MAKQVGTIKFTGTIGGVTFYRMNGAYYARAKSALSAKKVKTHPNFAQTRMYARWLGEASKMASVVYRELPPQQRKYELYCELKKMAYALVKKETNKEQIMLELRKNAENKRQKVQGIRVKNKRRMTERKRNSSVSQPLPSTLYLLPSTSYLPPSPLPHGTSFSIGHGTKTKDHALAHPCISPGRPLIRGFPLHCV
jgi:hypothetical protein